ncbi:MAG: haloacid dehalogenase-like hydrolase, partial [Clostridia bacterium]
KIAPWYLNQLQSDDLIISASPEFLLSYPCKTLGIAAPIASQISISDGSFIGNNCKGAEKVMRFHQNYGDTPIDCFYSDSLSDTPLAALANQAFLVTKSGMRPWP